MSDDLDELFSREPLPLDEGFTARVLGRLPARRSFRWLPISFGLVALMIALVFAGLPHAQLWLAVLVVFVAAGSLLWVEVEA
jgi:hypothetical protein